MQSTFFQLPKSPLSPDHRVGKKTQFAYGDPPGPKGELRWSLRGPERQKGDLGSQAVLALHTLGSESTECLHHVALETPSLVSKA